MSDESLVFLPGLSRQLNQFIDSCELKGKRVLVYGSNSEIIAKRISKKSGTVVELIVQDFDSLMNSRFMLENDPNVNIRLMDFEHTDFTGNEFDFVYAQACISTSARKGIVKEINRILKPGGILSVGEIIALSEGLPQFMLDIFDASDLDPLLPHKTAEFYVSRNFKLFSTKNANDTLKKYYESNLDKLGGIKGELNENEKSYYKKLLNRVSHESKAFLKHGGDKYIGFEILMLEKAGA